MSAIRSLQIKVGVDLSALSSQFDRAAAMADDFSKSVGSKLGAIGPAGGQQADPFRSVTEGADSVGSQVDQLASSLAPLVGQMKQAIGAAVQPLTQFAARFSAQFDQVGGAVLELSKRIDEHMRFPKFVERVEALRDFIRRTFGLIKGDMASAVEQAAEIRPDLSGLAAGFDAGRKAIDKAVAPIPGDVGYALEAAEHKDHRPAFSQFIAGVDEWRQELIRRTGVDPDAVDKAVYDGLSRGQKSAFTRARNQAKKELAQQQAAVPARDNTTAATQAQVGKLDGLRKALSATGQVAGTAFGAVGKAAQASARVVDAAIGVYLKFEKVKNVVSTFGSVAEKSFAKLKQIKAPDFKFDMSSSVVINGIGKAADGAKTSVKNLGAEMAVALGIFGLGFKAVEFLKKGAVDASNLSETISKVDAVLGDASGGVKTFADEMASKFGMVKGETLDLASGIGGLAKGLGGLSGDKLEGFTKDFTKLAADLSSFKNIDLKTAGEALRIGLSGEQSDQLKGLGVVLTEDAVKAAAFANGIAKVGQELTTEQKFAARAIVIQNALEDASGDLEKTQGGAANQFRKFTGTIVNLGTSIGSMLLPAVTRGINLLNQFGEWAARAFEGAKGTIGDFSDRVSTAFDYVSAATNNWKATFEVARLVIVQGLANIGEYFETLGPNIGIVAEYVAKNWKELLLDAINATLKGLQNLGKNFLAFGEAVGKFLADPTQGFQVDWKPLLDGFEATASEFPKLIKPHLSDMSREISAAAKPIVDEVKRKADAARAQAAEKAKSDAAKAQPFDAKAAAKAESEIEKFAKTIKEKTKTPLEEYREQLGKIKEAFNKKLIDEETGKRGVAEAEAKLHGDGPKIAGALQAGSTDARSAILAALTGRANNAVADNTRALVNQGQAGNGLLGRIAASLEKNKPAMATI